MRLSSLNMPLVISGYYFFHIWICRCIQREGGGGEGGVDKEAVAKAAAREGVVGVRGQAGDM